MMRPDSGDGHFHHSFNMRFLVVLCLSLPAALAFDCQGAHDGAYEVGCKSFITCVNGVGTITECAQDQVYNSRTGQCAPVADVGPPCGSQKDCKNVADGKYADVDNQCTSYYTCSGGTYFGHNYCSGSLVFNEHLQTCDWAAHTPPPCGTFTGTTTRS
ncbi:hypothetical protein C0Q70_06884 [Pomacea canaliculata]|uniref:Chitin-binding type-2 domain-containing protein n=1 Tax=Pomacea canaliculata TaxID=400727 RepID=A0A2T7PDH6_POMCA|nr:proprotein convertase subtilisin/kexin type 5-like [Pomacea canaliculata]PVD31472.1 hypothetical protein C0Q70_06884 [Pomacea canaliculata]